MNEKQILFLTTTNLAANPRLTKELGLAVASGFQATVLQFKLGNWSDVKTDELEKEFDGVCFITISALRKPFIPWLISSLLEKIASFLPIHLMNDFLLSVAVNKRSYLLMKEIKKITSSFSWVIAHNPGAFYPAYAAAKQTGASLGIDVEDYHPGETDNAGGQVIVRRLMQRILPLANYCSFAAPLILAEVKKDIPEMNNEQLLIINGFNKEEFAKPVDNDQQSLQLVWFSQYIDVQRGLENLIPVVNELYPDVELHLIGNVRPAFETAYLQNKTGIVLHGPKSQKELHLFLATCDVGLALEPGKDKNNQLAISNKLIACIQAGLFIAATHTQAQDQFLANSHLDFIQTEDHKSSIRTLLEELCTKKSELRKKKYTRFASGRAFDWQQVSKPLLKVWDNQ